MTQNCNYTFEAKGPREDIAALEAYVSVEENVLWVWTIDDGPRPARPGNDIVAISVGIYDVSEHDRSVSGVDGILMEVASKFPKVRFIKLKYTDEYGEGILDVKANGFVKTVPKVTGTRMDASNTNYCKTLEQFTLIKRAYRAWWYVFKDEPFVSLIIQDKNRCTVYFNWVHDTDWAKGCLRRERNYQERRSKKKKKKKTGSWKNIFLSGFTVDHWTWNFPHRSAAWREENIREWNEEIIDYIKDYVDRNYEPMCMVLESYDGKTATYKSVKPSEVKKTDILYPSTGR